MVNLLPDWFVLVGCIFSPSDGCCCLSTITKKRELENVFFPFFPLGNKPSPRHIACISPWRLLVLKKAMAPQPERLELGLKPPYLPRTLPSGGSQWQGGTKMEVRCMFFSPSDDTYDTGNFWWCDTFTFGSMFGWTLFWASFSGDTVFYQGFNDVFLTSKWKTFMTGWWWCYDYLTNIMIIMYLLIDAIWHLIWLCSLILSDDFDLINRHKKYNTSLLGLLTKRGTVPGGQVNLELQFSKCWY